jgi:hypothetical protein
MGTMGLSWNMGSVSQWHEQKVTLDMIVDEHIDILALDITYRLGRDAFRGLKSLFVGGLLCRLFSF